MNFETDFIFGVTQFSNAFRDALDKSLREIGLYSGQVFVLIFLWESDNQTQTALAEKLNLSAPTIHKMVKSLAENKFVVSAKCAYDARQMRVSLTEKGVEIRPLVERQWIKVEEAVFSSLTETEKLIFRQLVNKIRENLRNKA